MLDGEGDLYGVPTGQQHLSPLPSGLCLRAEGSDLLPALWRGCGQGQGSNYRQGRHDLHGTPLPRPEDAHCVGGQGRHHNWGVCFCCSSQIVKILFTVINVISSLELKRLALRHHSPPITVLFLCPGLTITEQTALCQEPQKCLTLSHLGPRLPWPWDSGLDLRLCQDHPKRLWRAYSLLWMQRSRFEARWC